MCFASEAASTTVVSVRLQSRLQHFRRSYGVRLILCSSPMAYAIGFILSPLCGLARLGAGSVGGRSPFGFAGHPKAAARTAVDCLIDREV